VTRQPFRSDRNGWTLRSRPGPDRSGAFGELAALRDALPGRSVLLDGEVVVFARDGRPDFAAVRRRLTRDEARAERHATFVVWDLLHLDGRSTRMLPLRARQALLAELLPPTAPSSSRAIASLSEGAPLGRVAG
jgi:bifunctional non-homologous end joining protein LigD